MLRRIEPPDRLAEEEIAVQLLRQPVAAIDLGAARRGEMIERLVLRPDAAEPALEIGLADRGEDLLVAGVALRGGIELPILHRHLETHRPLLAAGIEVENLAVIVLRQPPLAAIRPGLFLHRAARRPAQAIVVVRRVDAIIDRPEQPVRLMLEIPAARAAHVPQLLLVRDPVAIRVGVKPDIVRVRLADEHLALAERQQQARQQQPLREDAMLIVHAILLAAPVNRDAAPRLQLAGAVDVLHVSQKLRHIHPPIAIEHADRRLLDFRLAEHQLQLVSRRKLKRLRLLRRRDRLHRRLRRKRGVRLRRRGRRSGCDWRRGCGCRFRWSDRRLGWRSLRGRGRSLGKTGAAEKQSASDSGETRESGHEAGNGRGVELISS